MPAFSTTRRVRHAASDMFDLVADVQRYPEFVPLCRSLTVRERIDEPEGVTIVVADMTVAYKLLHETFTSRVTLDRPSLQIFVEYLRGPFSRMQNRWEFHAVGDHRCEVRFFIDYEFRSRTLGLVMGAVFDAAFRRFAEAFERRADIVFGRRLPGSLLKNSEQMRS
jgi:coenzyme Q-binding protein COQ10